MPLRSPLALAVLIVVLTVAGCAGAPPTPPPLPTPGPISTAPPAPLPRPADGDNLAACADGSCVVRVKTSSAIPLDPQLNVLNIRVEAIHPDEIDLAMDVTPGHFDWYGCRTTLTDAIGNAPGLVKAQCASGGRMTADKVSLGVVAIDQDVAIIRLITR